MLEKEKTFSSVVFLLLSSCGDNTAGGGFEARSRKNYISIERMSCCAGVTAPQSRDLRPLTPAEVCVYWNIDPSVLFVSKNLQDSQPETVNGEKTCSEKINK